MSVNPGSIAVGDRVQAYTGDSPSTEQPIGPVTAIDADTLTFLAEGEYDMYYGPGDEDYYTAYATPRQCTVALAAVTYHWPR